MKSLKNRIAAFSVAVLSLLIAGPVAVANAAVAVAPPATVTVSSSLNGTYYTGTLLVLWSAPVWSQVGSAPSAPTFGYSAAGVGAVVYLDEPLRQRGPRHQFLQRL